MAVPFYIPTSNVQVFLFFQITNTCVSILKKIKTILLSANCLFQGDPIPFLGKTEAINPEVFKTPMLIATDKIALLQITIIF